VTFTSEVQRYQRVCGQIQQPCTHSIVLILCHNVKSRMKFFEFCRDFLQRNLHKPVFYTKHIVSEYARFNIPELCILTAKIQLSGGSVIRLFQFLHGTDERTDRVNLGQLVNF